MKPQPGYIPSPYPIGTALETSILAALQASEITRTMARAMFLVAHPRCLNHNQPALVLWNEEPCCEACVREYAARRVRDL